MTRQAAACLVVSTGAWPGINDSGYDRSRKEKGDLNLKPRPKCPIALCVTILIRMELQIFAT